MAAAVAAAAGARIAVIGELVRVQGFELAGALVMVAEEPAAVRAAWRSLPADVAVVLLTSAAADALPDLNGRLTAVLPS
jgi:vacuolar-type H+-ATPase subunit F/Vma7